MRVNPGYEEARHGNLPHRRACGLPYAALSLIVGLVAFLAGPAQAQHVLSDLPITDGVVRATAISGSTLYIGGTFQYVGQFSGNAVPLGATSAAPLAGFPRVRGTVRTFASDHHGGWFVGGAFDSVGGLPRRNAAHVNADLTVAAWAPDPDADVYVILPTDTTVYVGGVFSNAGDSARSCLAAVDYVTGHATAWNPQVDGGVFCLALSGTTLFAGGQFSLVGAQNRKCVAGIDVTTAAATSFNAGLTSGFCFALVAKQTQVYAGGFMVPAGSSFYKYLFAFDSTSGALSAWDPAPNYTVRGMFAAGSRLHICGDFTTVGGTPRHGIASVDLVSGAVSPWNPNPDGTVTTIAPGPGRVYVGGNFTQIGGRARTNLAALDSATTGLAIDWTPNPNAGITAIATSDTGVYVAGGFSIWGGTPRMNVAAIDLTTGRPTAWRADASTAVNALALADSVVYIGTANGLYAVGQAPGSTPFTMSLSGSRQVQALAICGSQLIVGGTFTVTGIYATTNLAAFDRRTRQHTYWGIPGTNGAVMALTVDGSRVYCGGAFTNVEGVSRNYIAAIDSDGTLASWDANADGEVHAIVANGGTVYAAGLFTAIGWYERSSIGAIDAVSALATSWDPVIGGATPVVWALAIGGDQIYVGGGFSTIGGVATDKIGAIDLTTGLPTTWRPVADGNVYALLASGRLVFVGGAFNSMSGIAATGLAGLLDPTIVGVTSRPEPTGLELASIVPSPMRTTSEVRYSVPSRSRVSLLIFDVRGRQVRSVIESALMEPGWHIAQLQRGALPAGMYFIQLRIGRMTSSQKLVVMR